MRFPYVTLSINNNEISVFHLIRDNAIVPFLLLCYDVNVELSNDDFLKVIAIEKNNFNDTALEKAGFTSSFICLLRPDNYIGYIADAFDKDDFNQYLNSFMH